jgi:hypothetical protein
MTHFHVLVVGPPDTVAQQLAPYDENLRVDPHFEPTSELSLQGMRKNYGIGDNADLADYCAVMTRPARQDASPVEAALGSSRASCGRAGDARRPQPSLVCVFRPDG